MNDPKWKFNINTNSDYQKDSSKEDSPLRNKAFDPLVSNSGNLIS